MGTGARDARRASGSRTGREQNWAKSRYGQKNHGYRSHIFRFDRFACYRYETNGCFIVTRTSDVKVSVELAVKRFEKKAPRMQKV